MARKRTTEVSNEVNLNRKKNFIKFLTENQNNAWEIFRQSQIMFMLGPAGVGKSFIAMAFAVQEILNKEKNKIILTRPAVEAEEKLGFLPGDLNEKIAPYMLPLYDCLTEICGKSSERNIEYIKKRIEEAPLAYIRGRSMHDSICILDEAQNCTRGQLKLFLSRLGRNSRMIITADPEQSDLGGKPDIINVVDALRDIDAIGHIYFNDTDIVRNPLIREILRKL